MAALIIITIFSSYAGAICFLVYIGAGTWTLVGFTVAYLLMASGVAYNKSD